MARPLKSINWEMVKRRIEAGNNALSISRALDIQTDTFYRRFKEEFGVSFQDYRVDSENVRNDYIPFSLYMKALSGNPTMLIRLGEEFLGQGREGFEKNNFQEEAIRLRQMVMELKHDNENKKKLIEDLVDANKSEAR